MAVAFVPQDTLHFRTFWLALWQIKDRSDTIVLSCLRFELVSPIQPSAVLLKDELDRVMSPLREHAKLLESFLRQGQREVSEPGVAGATQRPNLHMYRGLLRRRELGELLKY